MRGRGRERERVVGLAWVVVVHTVWVAARFGLWSWLQFGRWFGVVVGLSEF